MEESVKFGEGECISLKGHSSPWWIKEVLAMSPSFSATCSITYKKVTNHLFTQGGAQVGLRFSVLKAQSLFLYHYLLIIVLFSIWITIKWLVPHPVLIAIYWVFLFSKQWNSMHDPQDSWDCIISFSRVAHSKLFHSKFKILLSILLSFFYNT